MARTQGRKIAIYDEGVLLADSIDVLNFSGSGHSASITNTSPLTVTETFSGSSGSSATGEVPTGSGTTFTLLHTPTTGTLKLYRGGARQQAGAGNDYTLSGSTITLAVALAVGEILIADYNY